MGPGMTQTAPTILQHTPGMGQPSILQQNPAAYPNSLPPTSIMPPFATQQQKPAPSAVSQPSQNGIIHLKGGATAVGAQNGSAQPSGEQQQQTQEKEDTKDEQNTTTAESATKETLANTKEKTPMCLINELARYNKVYY